MATLTEFLANITEGVTAMVAVVGDVCDTFMQPPLVIVPIAAVTALGYKLGVRLMKTIKNSA